jgi:hypothetical protein
MKISKTEQTVKKSVKLARLGSDAKPGVA